MRNDVSAARTPFTANEPALKQTLVTQRQKAEDCNQPTVVGSNQSPSPTSEQEWWADFVLPEFLSTPEAVRSCNSQDFPSLLIPETSLSETFSISADFQPSSSPASENVSRSNCANVVEPNNFEIEDTFYQAFGSPESGLSIQPSEGAICQELESTESPLSVQPSEGWVFDPSPSTWPRFTDMMTKGSLSPPP